MKAVNLDGLAGLLSQGQPWTAAGLAAQLGLSLRSVRRGLAQLREQGVVLDSEPGRGGGVRLARHSALPRFQLSHREALTLLMGLASAETLGAPLLAGELRSLRTKLGALFPPQARKGLNSLRDRILIGPAASAAVQASWRTPAAVHLSPLQDALFGQYLLNVQYVDAEQRTSQRRIEPQYLLMNAPAWYVLAWDTDKEAARCFRLDRLRRVQPLNEQFLLRPAALLMPDLGLHFERI
jgi:predicted DNA-binding transcriptional regulator YafY